MEERARITNEIARIKKALLLKGFATKTDSPAPIKDVNVHGLWDGIVGHPVDVRINVLVRNVECLWCCKANA